MKRRVRYDWKITDFVFNFFRFLSLSCYCCMRNKTSLHLRNRLKLFDKGETKFIKEFDAMHYARTMRNLATLVTSMIDENEQFMIKYQKSNALSLLSDTTSSFSDDNFESIPKAFARKNRKKIHKAKIHDFMVRFKFYLKNEYSKEKWSGRDYRLLNGVFNKQRLTRKY